MALVGPVLILETDPVAKAVPETGVNFLGAAFGEVSVVVPLRRTAAGFSPAA
ncbi:MULTISPECIES: hypothetical protein [unclassified Kitasatospora]|uniref:hypothetical protein n=1 Tax=unclassified Kitasatospora TaxID=2633591 RepID=UPI003811475E